MQNIPTLSVITICKNSQATIANTVKSVVEQDAEFEYVIIDGGSTDATLEVIKSNIGRRPYIVSSEPDEGIADAMNRGIEASTGRYILFLHSDDRLCSPVTLSQAIKELQKGEEIVAFHIAYHEGEKVFLWPPRGWDWKMRYRTGLWHTGTIISRSLHDRIGCYDKHFKIAMDYDFFLRAYNREASVKTSRQTLVNMYSGGISSRQDKESLKIRMEEEKAIHIRNSRSTGQRVLYSMYWMARLPYRRWIRRLPI